MCKNIEFGYKKLAIRGVSVFVLSSVLLINYCFKLLPDELTFCLWYIIGYCLTSCFFQIFLILKSKKQNNTPLDKQDDKQDDKSVDIQDNKKDDTPVNKQNNTKNDIQHDKNDDT